MLNPRDDIINTSSDRVKKKGTVTIKEAKIELLEMPDL